MISRGNAKQAIFLDDDDYREYLALLASSASRLDVRCAAYCLMPSHVHLLLRPGELPLWRMMQQVNSSYCQRFNRRHDRVGHVLQGRYRSLLVESGAYFLWALGYVLRNPVASEHVRSAAEWPWSSYRASVGASTPPDFLDLSYVWRALDPDSPNVARHRLAQLVATAPDDGIPLDALLAGSETFVRTCAPLLEPHRDVDDFVYAHRFAARPPLAALLGTVAPGAALDRAVHLAFLEHGYTLKEIGDQLRRRPCTVWSWIQRARRAAALELRGRSRSSVSVARPLRKSRSDPRRRGRPRATGCGRQELP